MTCRQNFYIPDNTFSGIQRIGKLINKLLSVSSFYRNNQVHFHVYLRLTFTKPGAILSIAENCVDGRGQQLQYEEMAQDLWC